MHCLPGVEEVAGRETLEDTFDEDAAPLAFGSLVELAAAEDERE